MKACTAQKRVARVPGKESASHCARVSCTTSLVFSGPGLVSVRGLSGLSGGDTGPWSGKLGLIRLDTEADLGWPGGGGPEFMGGGTMPPLAILGGNWLLIHSWF